MTGSGGITHAVTCPNCGRETYAYERDCHRCGTNRWRDET